jgi:hypothetical protein
MVPRVETMYRLGKFKAKSVGDWAVEGLLDGIGAGIIMLAVVVAFEFVRGVAPLVTLGYFDLGPDLKGAAASPLIGGLTHLAVSGVYGIVFGIVGMLVARTFAGRMNPVVWLTLGAIYGLLLFGIAQWIVLPRTNFPLELVPIWTFGFVYVLYGLVLAWLLKPGKN